MASVVESLLEELTDYHNVTGDARAGALVSVLYDAAASAKTDNYKDQVESRKTAEKQAANAEKSN